MRHLLTCAAFALLAAPAGGAEPLVLAHKERIGAVAFSPDHKLVATATGDGSVHIWDAKTGKELKSWEAHTGPATALAFAHDSKRLVTGGHRPPRKSGEAPSGEVKVWDAATGRLIGEMYGAYFAVEAVAFDPNGRQVAGTSGKTVISWDVAADEKKVTFEGHTGPVRALAYDPSGVNLVTAGEDGTIRVWHPDTGKLIHALKGHQGYVLAVGITPDHSRIVSGGQDHSVRIWNVKDGKEERKLTAHNGPVLSVAMNPDGKSAVSASGLDGTVRVWELETGKELRQIALPKEAKGPFRVAYSADGKRLAVACLDRTVRVYDLDAK